MQIGVNVPNFGPGSGPATLRRWAQTVEGLGFDLLMISDHLAVTPDVAQQYPHRSTSRSARSPGWPGSPARSSWARPC